MIWKRKLNNSVKRKSLRFIIALKLNNWYLVRKMAIQKASGYFYKTKNGSIFEKFMHLHEYQN